MGEEFTKADRKKLNRVDEIVGGNGDIGLRSQVKINTDTLKAMKSDVRWLVRLAVGAIVLQVIGIVMNSGGLG